MIEASAAIVLLSYTLGLAFLIVVSLRLPQKRKTTDSKIEPVSIVIPCKNEAHNIPTLIASLKRLEYPEITEIIFIDDNSIDGTAEIIEKFRYESGLNIRVLKNRFEEKVLLTGKQQAIDFGIREARYPYIVLTDADMTFDKDWLLSLVVSISPKIDLVFGHTAILPCRSLFTMFQSFQLAFLFSFAAIFHYCGILGSCMGNNIILRKSAYLECGGFKAIGYSITEDRALLRHFRRCGRGIDITIPFFPSAYTTPLPSIKLFFHQASRWIRGGLSNGTHLLALGIMLTVQNAFVVASVTGILSKVLVLLTMINFLLTWFFVFISFRKIKAPVSALWFPVYLILLIIETVLLLPAFIPSKRILWKGRTV